MLSSPAFVLSLAVLLLNDFWLKSAYPGALTGKLSDFAGLFAFSLVVAAFLPRSTGFAYATVALAWMWWKSQLSDGPIATWNEQTPYDLHRVVDYTDWIALLVLPVSYAYLRRVTRNQPTILGRRAMPLVLVTAAFAFGATSYSGTTYELTPDDPATTYQLGFPAEDFAERLDATGLWHTRDADGAIFVQLDDPCRTATFRDAPQGAATVSLIKLEPGYSCTNDKMAAQIKVFERDVVARLRGEREPLETKKPRGEPVSYPGDAAFTVALPAVTMDGLRCSLDSSTELHRLQDGIYTQRLGWGFTTRFTVVETETGLDLRVVEHFDGLDGESTTQQLEERFIGFIEHVTRSKLGPASPPQVSNVPRCKDPWP
jgi:hypothetical protein